MTELQTGISYFANRWPQHFGRDLDDIMAHGCTYIVHTFSENDLVFARGTMAELFRMTRDTGLGCWADPWGVMGLFGGEAFSAFVPRYPEACQVLSTGQRAPAACPNAGQTRDAMRRWIDAALEAGADTIFWDEPHLYIPAWDGFGLAPADAWACRCPRCQDRFRVEFGEPMPEEFTPAIRAFRQNLLLDFLGEMTAYVKDRGVRNAICLLPGDKESREGLPWNRASALPGVDVFGTDPYWYGHDLEVAEYVADKTRQVVATCQQHDLQPHIWVQAFRAPEGREGEIETALNTAVAEGATVLAAWGYRGCEALSSIACDRPDVVWDVIGRAYCSLLNRQCKGIES